jgi:hypothetical protein
MPIKISHLFHQVMFFMQRSGRGSQRQSASHFRCGRQGGRDRCGQRVSIHSLPPQSGTHIAVLLGIKKPMLEN